MIGIVEYWNDGGSKRLSNVILNEVKNLRDPSLSLRMTPNPQPNSISSIIPSFQHSIIPL
jgi:hypothetical protein